MRILRRTAVASLCALAMLASGGHAGAGPDHRRLDEIEDQIERKQEKIEEAEEQREGVLDRLAAADQEREELAERVTDLGAELLDAESRLAEVQARLDAAREALVTWGKRLERAREELREQEEELDARAATAYMIGPAGFLELLLGSEDLSALADRATYMESVLTIDATMITGLEVTRTLVGDHEAQVVDYEAQVAEEQERVEAEVARIQELREQQQEARAAVLEQIDVHHEVLEGIEETKQQYEQAVAELEAESARIAGVLQSSGSSGGGGGGGGGQLFWPTAGSITSGYGWRTHPIFGTQRFHAGVDIDGACGQPIFAAEDGTIVSAGYNGGYGNAIVIDHGDGLATLYAHQSSFAVSGGQVERGQTIGYVGTTGWSTGCHLHFEVRVNGEPVDPVPYL